MASTKKKAVSALAAVGVAAALALGGTFAWQSISQTALNEASDVVNPGGRLHDDFNGENKDVYVENFADEDIYARIRLGEYFEIISNYGFLADDDSSNDGLATTTTLLGSKVEVTDEETGETSTEYAYEVFKNYDSLAEGSVAAGVDGYDDYSADAAEGADGYAWWTWRTGGSTVYMPTFNMNKDSLAADVNGTYVDAVGGISNRDGSQYEGYVEYGEGDSVEGIEVYDADANSIDDGNVAEVAATHIAKPTEGATLMSMADWIAEGSNPGPYWVYDEDGWVYWAQPVPGRNEDGTTNATGLLLDSIELNQVMDDTWYYAINVEAQFVTADDLGAADGTGFYADGAPTDSALVLLEAIGVEVEQAALTGEVAVAGNPIEGVTLTATATDLPEGVTPAYQWYAGDDPIEGATGSTYAISSDYVEKMISVTVSDASGRFAGTVSSDPVQVRAAEITTTNETGATAYALLTESNGEKTLTFVRSYDEVTADNTYGGTKIKNYWTGFEEATWTGYTSQKWHSANGATTVVVANTIKPISTAFWFYNFIDCNSIDLTHLDTSQVTTMESMFESCSELSALTLGTGWDTSSVTNMTSMFYECRVNIDCSAWNVANVTEHENFTLSNNVIEPNWPDSE